MTTKQLVGTAVVAMWAFWLIGAYAAAETTPEGKRIDAVVFPAVLTSAAVIYAFIF